MCDCSSSDFGCAGAFFLQLKVGDVVELSSGVGNPTVGEVAVEEVLISIEGQSALTNTGRQLRCLDGSGVRPTGVNLGVQGLPVPVSVPALRILDDIVNKVAAERAAGGQVWAEVSELTLARSGGCYSPTRGPESSEGLKLPQGTTVNVKPATKA